MIFFDRKPAPKILPFDAERNSAHNSTRLRPNSGNFANPAKKRSNMVLTLPTLFSVNSFISVSIIGSATVLEASRTCRLYTSEVRPFDTKYRENSGRTNLTTQTIDVEINRIPTRVPSRRVIDNECVVGGQVNFVESKYQQVLVIE